MARKSLRKRLLNARGVHLFSAFVFSLLLRIIYMTCRVEKHMPSSVQPYIDGELPAVFCFWHGRMIMHPFVKPPGRSMSVLISHHNDGALITAVMRWFGIGSVRGSKKMGGTRALRNLLKVTQEGGNIAITPDGPRGPFQKAAPGATYVAAKTGYPLLPVTFSASRSIRFRSWDRFMLPKPFSRIAFVAAAALLVPNENEETLTQATAQLETSLVQITQAADALWKVVS